MREPNPKIAALVAELDKIDRQRLALKAKGAVIKEKLVEAEAEEQAEIWGLSPAEYDAARAPLSTRHEAEARLAAARSQEANLTRKAANPKYAPAEREAFAAGLAAVAKSIPELETAIETESREPLSVLLNRARVAKGLPPRKVLGGSVQKLG